MEKTSARTFPCGLLITLAAGMAVGQQASIAQDAPVWEAGPMAAPLPVRRPAELAPNPPRVKCQGSQLTIAAENSTLRSILGAVASCSGMQIDMPQTGAEERTYVQLGPGSTREVMDALLSASELDYVIEPSKAGTDKVAKILLIARAKEAAEPGSAAPAVNVAMTPARRAWMASRNTGRAVASSSDGEPSQTAPEETSPSIAPETASQASPAEPAASVAEAVEAKEPAAEARTTTGDEKASVKASPVSDATAATAAAIAAAATPDAAPAAAPASAPAAADANQDTGNKELQNRITDMQQLFEQRKKMNAAAQNPN